MQIIRREVTPAVVAKLTAAEGLRLLAYDDFQPKRTSFGSVSQIKGTPTIGYGHTGTVTKQDVVNGKRITKAEALRLKQADLADAIRKLYAVVKPDVLADLTDNQYGALVDFVYNCGIKSSWKIVTLLNKRRFDEVPDELIRFVFSKGKRMTGLVNRRRMEIDLWRSHEVDTTPVRALGVMAEAQPSKPLTASRTFKATVLSGTTGVLTALTAAIGQLSPYADDGILKAVLITMVCISTVAAFVGAALKAGDQKGAAA